MKAIVLLSLTIIFTACLQENKTGSINSGNITDTLKSIELQKTVYEIEKPGSSIVSPALPGKTITVGGNKADIQGFTSEAIQTAIDALHNTSNSGTVVLLPGNYEIFSPVRLYDNMSLTGSGKTTVLKKCKGFRSDFAQDADYGELQITVTDPSGFKKGMGVAIYDEGQRSGWDLTTAKIIEIKGNTLFIDNYLVRDYHADKKGTVSNNCSVIAAVDAQNIRISNLIVDGSKETNDVVDGCRAGGIYLHKVHTALIENVTVKNFNCDGISWQITEYVTVRNCELFGNANSGLHPGTGSPFSLIEGNNSYDNGGYGLFVCWRVRDGLVKNNSFHNNGINGICTGHKDTDMLYADNHVFENGSDGISLRGELSQNAPHRSIFRNNIIENNGTREKGFGLIVNCKAEGVVLEDNIIRNTGNGKQAGAVMLTANSLPVEMKNNKISGHKESDVVNGEK